MATETTFFQSGDITVTNARLIVGAQTFAISGITSVQGVETPASHITSIAVMLLGIILAIGGLAVSIFIFFGILIIALGVWLFFREKPKYEVVLTTAGGEVTAYQSGDKEFMSQVIHALNDSIVSRG